MTRIKVSSAQNPLVKQLLQLQKAHKRKKQEVFLIEGIREARRAFEAGRTLQKIFVSEQVAQKEADFLQAVENKGVEVVEFSLPIFQKISKRDNPDGCIALGSPWAMDLGGLKLSNEPLLMVVEGLEKPGNLGALIRSAESAGVDGLILCDPLLDPLGPSVIRNSQGAIFSIPLAVAPWEAVQAFLKQHRVKVVATTPHTQNIYWDQDLKGPIAVVLGNEHAGLSDAVLKAADLAVKVPLYGKSDSLNVSTASILVLYEVLRQKKMQI
jgi:TrmH family RNA methyltransferase